MINVHVHICVGIISEDALVSSAGTDLSKNASVQARAAVSPGDRQINPRPGREGGGGADFALPMFFVDIKQTNGLIFTRFPVPDLVYGMPE